MKFARTSTVICLSLVVAAAGGCGGGGKSGGGGSTSSSQPQASQSQPAQAPATGATTVTASEFKFQPSSVTATKGSSVTLKNGGTIGHDLMLRQGSKKVGGTSIINSGQTAQLKLNFPAGTYTMFCSVPGHEQAGMKGTFTIK